MFTQAFFDELVKIAIDPSGVWHAKNNAQGLAGLRQIHRKPTFTAAGATAEANYKTRQAGKRVDALMKEPRATALSAAGQTPRTGNPSAPMGFSPRTATGGQSRLAKMWKGGLK